MTSAASHTASSIENVPTSSPSNPAAGSVVGASVAGGSASSGIASVVSVTNSLLAGSILRFGSEEQKQTWLPKLATAEVMPAVAVTEPDYGSDVAGIPGRAVRDGDEWIVNGQKVWNTMAHIADFGMLVTRTDPEAPKHKGMTYFALDMHAPGVEVRPLRQITGEAEFNEVYMTDARVPDAHRIGDVGEGWRASLTPLMNERNAIGTGSGASGMPCSSHQARVPSSQRERSS